MDLVDEDLYLSEDGQETTTAPTAPPDIGTLYIRLDWPEDDIPQIAKWAHMVQKALQSWFNTTLANEMGIGCNIHKLEPLGTPGCAEVVITPFSALDVLLSKKSFSLMFKDLKQMAIVHFYSSAADMIHPAIINNAGNANPSHSSGQVQIPMQVNAVVDVKKFSAQIQAEVMKKFKKHSTGAHCLSMQGTLEEVNVFYADLCQTVTQKEQGKNSISHSRPTVPSETSASEEKGSEGVTCHVPFYQYQAACQKYRKEMEVVEKENNVRIQAEVTLSFINNGAGTDLRSKACQDITRLIQNCVGTPGSQADLPSKKKNAFATRNILPQKDVISHSRGLGNSSGKAGHISMEVNRREAQTEGVVKNQFNSLPLAQPLGEGDITTRVSVPGKIKEMPRAGRKDEVTAIDGVSQNAAHVPQEATQTACREGLGNVEGNQPLGTMYIDTETESLPGFLAYGTIVINYDIPSAVQTNGHPNPGKPFQGIQVTAYLPDSPEGKRVVELLKKAFSQRLVFTVVVSKPGGDGRVIWNGISHKTNKYGGPLSNGYPDPHYIEKIKEELKTKGIE